MTKVKYEIHVKAPLEQVYEYYTNPDNIKEAWPQDIVKDSQSLSGSKNEEESEMKVKGKYMGREDEMILQITDKEQNKRLNNDNDYGRGTK
jgi:ligand-binding SRPBCC domain-containing protein